MLCDKIAAPCSQSLSLYVLQLLLVIQMLISSHKWSLFYQQTPAIWFSQADIWLID